MKFTITKEWLNNKHEEEKFWSRLVWVICKSPHFGYSGFTCIEELQKNVICLRDYNKHAIKTKVLDKLGEDDSEEKILRDLVKLIFRLPPNHSRPVFPSINKFLELNIPSDLGIIFDDNIPSRFRLISENNPSRVVEISNYFRLVEWREEKDNEGIISVFHDKKEVVYDKNFLPVKIFKFDIPKAVGEFTVFPLGWIPIAKYPAKFVMKAEDNHLLLEDKDVTEDDTKMLKNKLLLFAGLEKRETIMNSEYQNQVEVKR